MSDHADFVRFILNATMPDGSPIRASVKADTILTYFNLAGIPSELKGLITQGICHRRRRPSRRKHAHV